MSDDLNSVPRTRATRATLAIRARNHFELFDLPVRYQLDRQLLSTRYLELTRATHPDFAGTDPEAQLHAMELSARVNEAHAILDDDLRRAEYLLELRGQSPAHQLSPDLLERIFEMRESLSLAQSSEDDAEADNIRAHATDWLGQILTQAGALLDAATPGPEIPHLLAAARYIRKIATA